MPEEPNQPSTAHMEVHHHPIKHEAGRKFKEYFLEFLMIFLAVTLGFFAESLREKISDKEKEKEYIGQFTNKLLPLISNDSQKIKLLFNKVSYEIGATNNYLNNLRSRLPFVIHMIDFFKKEYDIE